MYMGLFIDHHNKYVYRIKHEIHVGGIHYSRRKCQHFILLKYSVL